MSHRVTAPAMQRVRRLLNECIRPAVLTDHVPFSVEATDEIFEIIPYHDAVSLPRQAFDIGTVWGKPWHTRWFRLVATVPESHAGDNTVASIDLGFDGRYDGFQVEGLVWRDGRIVHAVQPDRRLVRLGRLSAGDIVELWVEGSATPVIAGHASGYGPTPLGDPATAGETPRYQLRKAHLALFDDDVHQLVLTMHAAIDLTLDLPDDAPQRARLFDAFERVGNVVDRHDVSGSASTARRELDRVFQAGKSPAEHRIIATGHAHLDTAWLWPIRETRRKVIRTFANAIDLLRRNPDVVYCHSQAQHYAWVAELAPELFDEVRRLVAEGRWEVVGGMWVETDLNLPSGESLLRQMVHGQRSFREWFGVTCDGAFLPDDFGYPGGLPQIVAHCGARWFFTQKLSWNETNKFPHHTFWWEGIDGTRVFAHFSPIDSYNAVLTPSQLRFASRNFLDHRGASSSLALFGHGDGGGGPTQDMIDRGRLSVGLDGVPGVTFGRIDEFYADAEAEYGSRAAVWVGEMYFEKHRGTYSSQIGTKQGNRRSEQLLHELEVWSASTGVKDSTIDAMWQRVLTQQFHDIIPGSSIAWVHDDAEREHAEVASAVEERLALVLATEADGSSWVVNSAPVAVHGVVEVNGEPRWFEAEALTAVESSGKSAPGSPVVVNVDPATGSICLSNGEVIAAIDASGHISTLTGGGRDVITRGATTGFVLRRDTPAEYDAWDIDMDDANSPASPLVTAIAPRVVESGPLRAVVETVFATASGSSSFVVRHVLEAGSAQLRVVLDADWNERELRCQFVLPTAVFARRAVCGTQFGHVDRPRMANTSWDVAMFEVCAHRYVHVSEPGLGVAILADGPRGYDIRGDELKLTLLRSPSFPDPNADAGQQHIEWSLSVDDGSRSNLEKIAARNAHPVRVVGGRPAVTSVGVRLDSDGAQISAVKPADDDSGDLVVRLWETRGATSAAHLVVDRAMTCHRCDGLESPIEDVAVDGGSMVLDLRPFEIVTLRVSRSS